MNHFERDLATLKEKLADNSYAQKVYAALCNVEWTPVGGTHAPECMILNGITDDIRERVKVSTVVDGKLVTGEPEPWCDCGLSYACTWRYAGGLVADLRGINEDYLDFYCSGGEGSVDDDVRADLLALGWELRERGRKLTTIRTK